LLHAFAQVTRGLLFRGEPTGGFDDDLHAEVTPGDLRRIGRGEDAEFFPVDGDAVRRMADGIRNRAVDGVVFEQIGQRGRIGEIVYGDELDALVLFERGTDDVASDAPETVHSNFDHGSSSCGG